MPNILLFGAGKIGSAIAKLLLSSGRYKVTVCDNSTLNLQRLTKAVSSNPIFFPQNFSTEYIQPSDLIKTEPHPILKDQQAIVSALPYFENKKVADLANANRISYFDLTEDVATTDYVKSLSADAKEGQIFMPQCGLAPGYVGIVAHALAKDFDIVRDLKMRIGALPQYPTNRLKYNITWSVDGLINEYLNPCDAIHNGKRVSVQAMEGLEWITVNGTEYECFNTSGGLGTLCETLNGHIQNLDYKTIRYPGHRDLMTFLLNDMRLGSEPNRLLLKTVLETAIPATTDDVVVAFISASGYKKNVLTQTTDARKIYSRQYLGEKWTAIQITTAAGICAAIDMHFAGKLPKRGFVRQEDIDLDEFLANKFGRLYLNEST